MNITVIYGSYRDERQGIKAANFIIRHLKERGHDVAFVDAMEIDMPILGKMYKEYPDGKAPAPLNKLKDIYEKTDGFLLVTGEYNHAPTPGLKNILDYFLEEYFFKASAILSYSVGGFGGVRAAVHLRDILSELGMPAISSNFPVSRIAKSLDGEGNDLTENAHYDTRVQRFLDEFEWYTEALKNQRAKKGNPY